jgi:hypothetical protein
MKYMGGDHSTQITQITHFPQFAGQQEGGTTVETSGQTSGRLIHSIDRSQLSWLYNK